MQQVLALPLEEAVARLSEEGIACEVELVLTPKMSEEDFKAGNFRRYVARQRELGEGRALLSVVLRKVAAF